MLPPSLAALAAAVLLASCSVGSVQFPNARPGAPRQVPAAVYRPDGRGPFPAVALFHPCHGVTASTRTWAEWLRQRGYEALVVDSWAARGITDGCRASAPDLPSSERFDDAVGALQFLQAQPDVDPARIGAMGWSQGGVFAIAAVNGPSLERARARGVVLPEPGYQAAIAFYPGGCYSLVQEAVVKPLLVLIGEADDWTLARTCAEMVDAMRRRGAPASIVRYPGVRHYFDVEGLALTFLPDVGNRNRPGGSGATVGYDPAAAADARRRVEAFLRDHLGGVPARRPVP
jgi:dienelactone hydrolase